MDLGLSNRRVMIGGATRGIGHATAAAFLAEGARVAIVGRDQARLDAAAASLGAGVVTVRGDLSVEADATAAVSSVVSALGGLDVLVNNVGGSLGTGAFGSVSMEDFRRVVDANMWSAIFSSHAALPALRDAEHGGVILHVSSISAREYCSSAPYAAAKAALTGLTKEMAVDLAKARVRVNAIAPGSILFEGGSWDRRLKSDPERIEKMRREELPWGRFGTPEEVASVAVFLCSDKASWVTGSTVVVDGAQGRAL